MILARHHWHPRDRLLSSKVSGLLHIWNLGLRLALRVLILRHVLRVLVLRLGHDLRSWVLRLCISWGLLHARSC